MNTHLNKKIENAVMYIVVVVFALILLASLAVPLVLSIMYTWKWMLLYPVMLAGFLLILDRK